MAIQEDLLKLAVSFVAGGITSYVISTYVFGKKENAAHCNDTINLKVEKDKAKVVNSYDIEDLPDKVAYCRCWKSSKFPYCDGTHNAHNKMTGDNVGPLCLQRKSN